MQIHKKMVTLNIFFYRTIKSGELNFYSGDIVRGDQRAVVFISPAILPALNTSLELHVDATFDLVPRYPAELKQMMTLSVVSFDHVRIKKIIRI